MVEQQIGLGVANKLRYLACHFAVRNPYAENVVSCHGFTLRQKSPRYVIVQAGSSASCSSPMSALAGNRTRSATPLLSADRRDHRAAQPLSSRGPPAGVRRDRPPSARKSVGQGRGGSVRVDLGG